MNTQAEQQLAILRMMQWVLPLIMLIGAAAAYMLLEDEMRFVVAGVLVLSAAADFLVFKHMIAKKENG